MSYVAVLQDALADVRAMNENLRRKRNALRAMPPAVRHERPPRVRAVPRDYYHRAPRIPPWAINRGGQRTVFPGNEDDE